MFRSQGDEAESATKTRKKLLVRGEEKQSVWGSGSACDPERKMK